ncbi:MAG: hypothetical protein ACREN2_03005 [Candidatus Dormibacteria bacterium]
MSSAAPSILALLGALVVLSILLTAANTVDLAGPLRSWFWSRDARRMRRGRRFPAEVRRAYWSRRQYDRDAPRLLALGYRVTSEEAADPYVTLPSAPAFGRSTPRPRRRRVPCIYVAYEHAEPSPEPASGPR